MTAGITPHTVPTKVYGADLAKKCFAEHCSDTVAIGGRGLDKLGLALANFGMEFGGGKAVRIVQVQGANTSAFGLNAASNSQGSIADSKRPDANLNVSGPNELQT